ncbi:hypothetical protein PT974_04786 [Cladobotryum mycophilum]|uniref:Uncharacterized protein n=1 Tax=Cladobotryum mycophilum TaxID=491253 RepID=A0ABR0SQB2_9HYPO
MMNMLKMKLFLNIKRAIITPSSSESSLVIDIRSSAHKYVALKVYIHYSRHHFELPFYEALDRALPSKHYGANNIRKLIESFDELGPHGKHVALVLQLSQISLRDINTVFFKGHGSEELFVKGAIKELLQAIDFPS